MKYIIKVEREDAEWSVCLRSVYWCVQLNRHCYSQMLATRFRTKEAARRCLEKASTIGRARIVRLVRRDAGK